MTSWAKVGVKCVCVEGGSTNSDGFALTGKIPLTGQVYTITAVFPDPYPTGKILICLLGFNEPSGRGWNVARFAPLVTKTQQQDVAMFKRIATSAPVHETAE